MSANLTQVFKEATELLPKLNHKVASLRNLLSVSSRRYRPDGGYYDGYSQAGTQSGGSDSGQIAELRAEIDPLARRLHFLQGTVVSVVPDTERDLADVVRAVPEHTKWIEAAGIAHEKWTKLKADIDQVLASVREVMGADWGGVGPESRPSKSVGLSGNQSKRATSDYLVQNALDLVVQTQYAVVPASRTARYESGQDEPGGLVQRLTQEFSSIKPPAESLYTPRHFYDRQRYRS